MTVEVTPGLSYALEALDVSGWNSRFVDKRTVTGFEFPMVQVPGPVPQNPPQFSGGRPVESRVFLFGFEDELHAPILSRGE